MTALLLLLFALPADSLDVMYFTDGSSWVGSVVSVEPSAVTFREADYDGRLGASTRVAADDIALIVFADGTTYTYSAMREPTSSGPDTGLIILASVGATLAVLLLIGAAAQR